MCLNIVSTDKQMNTEVPFPILPPPTHQPDQNT